MRSPAFGVFGANLRQIGNVLIQVSLKKLCEYFKASRIFKYSKVDIYLRNNTLCKSKYSMINEGIFKNMCRNSIFRLARVITIVV